MKLTINGKMPEAQDYSVTVNGETKIFNRKNKSADFEITNQGTYSVTIEQVPEKSIISKKSLLIYILLFPIISFLAFVIMCLLQISADEVTWVDNVKLYRFKCSFDVDVSEDREITFRAVSGKYRENRGTFDKPDVEVKEKDNVIETDIIYMYDINSLKNEFISAVALMIAVAFACIAFFTILAIIIPKDVRIVTYLLIAFDILVVGIFGYHINKQYKIYKEMLQEYSERADSV